MNLVLDEAGEVSIKKTRKPLGLFFYWPCMLFNLLDICNEEMLKGDNKHTPRFWWLWFDILVWHPFVSHWIKGVWRSLDEDSCWNELQFQFNIVLMNVYSDKLTQITIQIKKATELKIQLMASSFYAAIFLYIFEVANKRQTRLWEHFVCHFTFYDEVYRQVSTSLRCAPQPHSWYSNS